MRWKSDNIEIIISDKADKVIKKLFDSIKNRYQNNLQSVRGNLRVISMIYCIINCIINIIK